MTLIQEKTEVPRTYQPYDFLIAKKVSDQQDSFPEGKVLEFENFEGKQELITVVQQNNETRFVLKQGHLYKCESYLVFANLLTSPYDFHIKYSWIQDDELEIGSQGRDQQFSTSHMSFDKPARAIVDATEKDVEVFLKVTYSQNTGADHFLDTSDALIEVIPERSGPWNQKN